MNLTFDQIRALPLGTKLQNFGYSCDLDYVMLGTTTDGLVVARDVETGVVSRYQPEFFTGRVWSVFDTDGFLIPASDLQPAPTASAAKLESSAATPEAPATDRPIPSAAEIVALSVSQLQPADLVAASRAGCPVLLPRVAMATRFLRWAIASANHSTGSGHVVAAEIYFSYADQRFGWKIAQGEYGPQGKRLAEPADRIIVGISRGGRFALLTTSADTSRPIFERLAALAIVSPFAHSQARRRFKEAANFKRWASGRQQVADGKLERFAPWEGSPVVKLCDVYTTSVVADAARYDRVQANYRRGDALHVLEAGYQVAR